MFYLRLVDGTRDPAAERQWWMGAVLERESSEPALVFGAALINATAKCARDDGALTRALVPAPRSSPLKPSKRPKKARTGDGGRNYDHNFGRERDGGGRGRDSSGRGRDASGRGRDAGGRGRGRDGGRGTDGRSRGDGAAAEGTPS